MPFPTLDKLKVLVTGVDTAIARDVVRLVAAEGASVVAADPDTGKLAQLDADVGLCRTRVATTAIDLASPVGVRLWQETQPACDLRPHLMICCCGAPRAGRGRSAQAGDVTLSEQAPAHCPALAAARVLQPTLFLHAQPLRHSVFDRAISVLRHPTLRGVLERSQAGGADAVAPYLRPAASPSHSRRPESADARPGGTFRLTPDPAPPRADAA
jgi:hypothetical protein